MIIINGKNYKCGDNPVNRIEVGKFLYVYYRKYYIANSINDVHGRFKYLFKILEIGKDGSYLILERGTKLFSFTTMKDYYVNHANDLTPIKAEVIFK